MYLDILSLEHSKRYESHRTTYDLGWSDVEIEEEGDK